MGITIDAASKLLSLFKAKDRPIGYRTKGGYVKTAKGWRKLLKHKLTIKKPDMKKPVPAQARLVITDKGYIRTDKGWRKATKAQLAEYLKQKGKTSAPTKSEKQEKGKSITRARLNAAVNTFTTNYYAFELKLAKLQAKDYDYRLASPMTAEQTKLKGALTRYITKYCSGVTDNDKAELIRKDVELQLESARNVAAEKKINLLSKLGIAEVHHTYAINFPASMYKKGVIEKLKQTEYGGKALHAFVASVDGSSIGLRDALQKKFKSLSGNDKWMFISEDRGKTNFIFKHDLMKPREIRAMRSAHEAGLGTKSPHEVSLKDFYDAGRFKTINAKQFNGMVSERFENKYGIKVKGFNKTRRLQLEYLDNLLDKMPRELLTKNSRLKAIIYRKKIKSDNNAIAMYRPNKNVVEMLDVSDDAQGRQTFNLEKRDSRFASCVYHEIGHSLNHYLLSSSRKAKHQKKFDEFAKICGWNKFSLDNYKTERSTKTLISRYATEDQQEALAEYFCVYMAHRESIDKVLDGQQEAFNHISYRDRVFRVSLTAGKKFGLSSEISETHTKAFKFIREMIYNKDLYKAFVSIIGESRHQLLLKRAGVL